MALLYILWAARINDQCSLFFYNGYIPSERQGALSPANTADGFEPIEKRGDVLPCDFDFEYFFSFAVLPVEIRALNLRCALRFPGWRRAHARRALSGRD